MRLCCAGPHPRIDVEDPALRLTAAQKQAMAVDRELIVTAGAGAGKTTVLALRYVALLLSLASKAIERQPHAPRPDIQQVLVLTFTEKAAEEMGERCYRRLIALSDTVRREGPDRETLAARYGPAYPGRLAAALDHLIDHFEAARIGTFHSYCARILRSFPGESGTAPDFEILDDASARQLRETLAERVLRTAYAEDADRLRLLANAVGGHRAIREALLHALNHRAVLRDTLTRHAHGEVTVRDLLALFPETPDQMLFWLETTALEVLEAILDAVALSSGGERIGEIRALLHRIEALREADEPDALHIAATTHDVLAALCVASGKSVRRLDRSDFLGPKEAWRTAGLAHRADAKSRLESVQELCTDWPDRLKLARGLPRPADASMLGALQVLGELFLKTESLLDEALRGLDAVDFDTLQDRAVTLVRTQEHVRNALIAEHRYLMVDEFQDTDARQWALVRAIARPHDQASDRLFVVGDAKQAIYRFRGGDVSVYRRAMQELGTAPVTFPDNFRSRDALIAWFNHFFARLMGPHDPRRPAFEAPYDPLTAGRGQAGGSVTLVIHEATTASEDALREADGVARLIAGRILPRLGDFADLELPERGVRGDPPIAILLRTRTHMQAFEAALRRHQVSHVVAKGVSFWSRPEIRDAVNLMDALANGDPISIIGALRSPWIGLSDQDLQDLHEGEWGRPVDGDPFVEFGRFELDDLAPPRVHRAAAVFARLAALRSRLSPSRLLRTIVDTTAAVHAMSLDDPSGQAIANVQRLIERVRDLDSEGLAAASSWLVRQVQASTSETEALVPPTDARVVLMTVHASKGLEFPVVIVPGCGGRSTNRHGALTHGSIGEDWHVACRALDPKAEVRVRVRTGLHGLLSAQEAEESRAEAQRLLYVAATRARDHLVLLGTQPAQGAPDRPPVTWSEMLAAVHGVEDAEGQRLLVPTGDIAELEPGHRDGLRIIELATCTAIETGPAEPTAPPLRPDPGALERIAPLTPARLMADAQASTLEISPSSLDLLVHEPARWYKRSRLGIPDDDVQSRAAARLKLAAIRGEVIHSLLEDDIVEDTSRAVARWRAHAFSAGAPPELVEDGVPELLAHLHRTANDPRVSERLLAHGMSEVRFRLPAGDVTLGGQIDRLYRGPDGGWVVLDWKSERLDGPAADPIAAARRHARQLIAYAWAADRILRAQGQGGVTRCEVYFTATAQLVAIGPLGVEPLQAIERELVAAGKLGALTWEEVLAAGRRSIAVLDVDALPVWLVDATGRASAQPDADLPERGDLPERADLPEVADTPAVPDEPDHHAEPERHAEPDRHAEPEPERRAEPEPERHAEPEPRVEDPFAALRRALGLGPAATGATPVPPRRTQAPPAPSTLGPEPPPAEPEDYAIALENLPDEGAAPPDPTEEEVTRLSAAPPAPDTPVPPPVRPRVRPRPKRRSRRGAPSPNQLSLFGTPPQEGDS